MRTQRGGNGNFRDRLTSFRRQPPVGQDCSSTDISPPSFNGAVYYTFAAYLLVVTVTLSDEKLFVANTGITLPIISLVVPFLGFFVLAPLFLIILHAHALGSMQARSTRDQRSIKSSTKIIEGRRYIEPAIYFLFSPIAIAVVFWRLADYQSFSLSGFHFFLLALNPRADPVSCKIA